MKHCSRAIAVVALICLSWLWANPADAARPLVFNNTCDRTIHIAVHIQVAGGAWETRSWFTAEPGGTARITSSVGDTFYYVAMGRGVAWPGEDGDFRTAGSDNLTYGFRKATVNDYTSSRPLDINVSCAPEKGKFGKTIKLVNRCSSPVRVAVRYFSLNEIWTTSATFLLQPNRITFLRHTLSDVFYLHQSQGGREWISSTTNRQYKLNGKMRNFEERRLTADWRDIQAVEALCK